MKILCISQNNFTGTKIYLQDADWVCRKVKTAFPAISPNRLYFENPALFISNNKLSNFIREKGNILQQDRQDRKFLKSSFKFLKEIIYSVKDHKVAHCNELSAIAELVARINGIKNCCRLNMKDHDHTFLVIGQKPIENGLFQKNNFIVDPWLGISGHAEDVFMKFQNVYNRIFKFYDGEDVSLRIKKPLLLSEDELTYFKDKYPELIFSGRNGRKLMDFDE